MQLEAQGKEEERYEYEEIHDAGNNMGIFFEEAWLVFEVQNLNEEWYCSSYLECSSVLPAAVLDYSTFRGTVCKIKFFCYFLCFFMYCLHEKYYKSVTVQYYIVNCVSWVPKLC